MSCLSIEQHANILLEKKLFFTKKGKNHAKIFIGENQSSHHAVRFLNKFKDVLLFQANFYFLREPYFARSALVCGHFGLYYVRYMQIFYLRRKYDGVNHVMKSVERNIQFRWAVFLFYTTKHAKIMILKLTCFKSIFAWFFYVEIWKGFLDTDHVCTVHASDPMLHASRFKPQNVVAFPLIKI